MPAFSMMLSSILQKLEDIILGIFAIIPQVFYFIYASVASLLDVCQLLVRKLAGLDVYYVSDSTGVFTERKGDILKDFIEGILGINKSYSALSTVFWSMLIFGVIVLVLSTIFSIIKAHYNYDSEKSQPSKIIGNTLKSLALMAITPAIVLFGVYLSEVFLTALDNITSTHQSESISGVYESEALSNLARQYASYDSSDVYYASFDMFGIKEWTNTSTFSGIMFSLVTNSANRVRLGNYTAVDSSANDKWDSCDIFYSRIDNLDQRREKVASQIDFAFENCLTLQNSKQISIKNKSEASYVIASTLTYGPSAGFAAGLVKVDHFSKFNVGLVWYYYNLWAGNYFLGFAGVIACLVLLSNIIFGLMKRLVLCIILFLVNAPVIAISPLDQGNGFKTWRQTMLSYFLSVFGAVIGMNLFFMILPYLNSISFFGPNLAFLDKIFDMLIVLAGLTVIKNIIKLVSSFIGAVDLNDEGQKAKKEAGTIAAGAAKRTLSTARVGVKLGVYAATGGIVFNTAKSIAQHISARNMVKEGRAIDKKDALRQIRQNDKNRIFKAVLKSSQKVNKVATNLGGAVLGFAGSTFGKFVLNYTGISPGKIFESSTMDVKDENGDIVTLDKKATRRARGAQRIKEAGARLYDLSGKTLKAVSAGAGLSEAFKNLKNKGVYDDGKMVVQDIFQTVGFKPDPKSKLAEDLITEDQKDEKRRNDKDKLRRDTLDYAFRNKQASAQIFEIVEKIKKL